MSWGALIVSGIGYLVNSSAAAANQEKAEGMASDAKIAQQKAQAQLAKEKEAYKSMQIKNMYADMENPYEDLTVNQQQANFESRQIGQQQANIMQGLRGAAGSSGIASLAQAMANQGQLATSRISASIGMQETRNQALMARGAAATDMAERGGAQWQQAAQMDKQATILGMEYGEAAGANVALQRAQTNEMNATLAQQQITADFFSTAAQGAMGKKQGRPGDPNAEQYGVLNTQDSYGGVLPPNPTNEETAMIDGKQYQFMDGKWYDDQGNEYNK